MIFSILKKDEPAEQAALPALKGTIALLVEELASSPNVTAIAALVEQRLVQEVPPAQIAFLSERLALLATSEPAAIDALVALSPVPGDSQETVSSTIKRLLTPKIRGALAALAVQLAALATREPVAAPVEQPDDATDIAPLASVKEDKKVKAAKA